MTLDKDGGTDDGRDAYAVVGELVLISSAIDFLSNRLLIVVLDLGDSVMLDAVIATLDTSRKVEILKGRADHMPATEWKRRVTKFCDKVENVLRQRNIACHTPGSLNDDVWTFTPISAAKMLKKLDLKAKTIRPTTLDDFRVAIATGEAALSEGTDLIERFEHVNAEMKKRRGTHVQS